MAPIDFVAEAHQCPACGGALRVQKSRQRTVVTRAEGAFRVREVLKQCTQNSACPVVGSSELARRVPSRQRYGYDLIVYVGLARYLAGRQREEIRAELREHDGIELSAGTVSQLCDRFLGCLEALHRLRVPQLRAAMGGAYPLHLDATCDRGKGGLFVCLDGWRGWVLLAARIASERQEILRPLVEKTVAWFGEPIATVRDLGEAGARAVEPLNKRGTPDLVCHYHFLGAVGKQLFDKPYSLLRTVLRTTNLRSDLRACWRELRRYQESRGYEGRFGPGRVRDDLLALVLWLLEATGTKDSVFPFSLPHLDFVRRCQQAIERAERWVPTPRTQPERRAIGHLAGLVARLERDPRIATTVQRLEQSWQGFCELRDVLRLTNAELPRARNRSRQPELAALELLRLQEIEQACHQYREQLRQRAARPVTAPRSSPSAIILTYLERYGDHLFGHPALRDEHGGVLAVVERTNNPAEHFFGQSKQRLRRRLGRANLGRDLEQQPAQAALVANLRHPDYVQVLCGTLDQLPQAFAGLTVRGVEMATPLLRDHRDADLQRRVRTLLKGPDKTSVSHLRQPRSHLSSASATVS